VRDRAQLALSQHAPASFGLALHPFDGRSADALLHAADEQMYAAKAARRTAD
jgi:GGDEF domain-containing protein